VALDIAKLGSRYGPTTTVVDAVRARAYAAATNDDSPAYRAGPLAPPLFGVVPAWDTMMGAVLDVVPADALPMLLHLEHDMHFHQPLTVGQTLSTQAEVHSVRVRRSGTQVTVLVTSRDSDGAPVLDQYGTMFVRGLVGGESGGPDLPDHALPAASRDDPVAERTAHVDADQTWRYRNASGDTNPIHVDEAFAKEAGLPGIIVHGLCTMAFCSHAVIAGVAGGDPALVRRLAVRFSRPVRPGTDVVTTVWDLGDAGRRRMYGFEARSQDEVVVKDGRAELGPPGS
jgi:acyl dehydratase